MTPSEIGISQEAWQLSQNGFGQPFPLRVELATFLDYIFFSKDGITCGGTKYFTQWHLVSLNFIRAKS